MARYQTNGLKSVTIKQSGPKAHETKLGPMTQAQICVQRLGTTNRAKRLEQKRSTAHGSNVLSCMRATREAERKDGR